MRDFIENVWKPYRKKYREELEKYRAHKKVVKAAKSKLTPEELAALRSHFAEH